MARVGRLASRAWNEAAHPRDARGRFTSGGGSEAWAARTAGVRAEQAAQRIGELHGERSGGTSRWGDLTGTSAGNAAPKKAPAARKRAPRQPELDTADVVRDLSTTSDVDAARETIAKLKGKQLQEVADRMGVTLYGTADKKRGLLLQHGVARKLESAAVAGINPPRGKLKPNRRSTSSKVVRDLHDQAGALSRADQRRLADMLQSGGTPAGSQSAALRSISDRAAALGDADRSRLASMLRSDVDTAAASRGRANPPPAPTPSVPKMKQAIRDAVRAAVPPGDYVMLSDIRRQLPSDWPRADVDRALNDLANDPDVNVVPESNQKMLRPEDRAAALRRGGQQKHLIAIR